jgi:hypothetical protein
MDSVVLVVLNREKVVELYQIKSVTSAKSYSSLNL